jgi:hypothetical protein
MTGRCSGSNDLFDPKGRNVEKGQGGEAEMITHLHRPEIRLSEEEPVQHLLLEERIREMKLVLEVVICAEVKEDGGALPDFDGLPVGSIVD